MKRSENSNQDLLDMIAALLKQIEGKDEMISVILEQNNELQHTISNLESTVAKLNDQIATMQRSLYGVKSEKSQNIKKDDNNKGNGGVGCNNLSDENVPAKQKSYKSPARRDYDSIKPTKTITIKPSEEEMKGARFVKKLISYHFNFVPAHIEKEEIVRYVYEKDGHLIIPPLPDVPEGFEKRHLSASLAAGILSYKYHLHMPFERQLVMLDGSKIKLAKTTLFDYSVAAADALDGIYEAIRERVLSDYRCHIDETVQNVVDKEKHCCRKGYDWGFVSPKYKMMFFTSTDGSRGHDVLDEQLKEFKGKYIQTDGYNAYTNAGERIGKDIVQIPCMSHIRRKFFDAIQSNSNIAEEGLEHINRMFGLEKEMRDKKLTKMEIEKERRLELKPMLDRFKIWLLEKTSDPKFIEDNLGKAINYALERIDKFYELMKNGLLKLENNLAERCMRGHTLGRKNYLFCQNAESESRTCKVYTIIESCKLSGIDPYRYLNYIFSKPPKLGETWENYLPCNLKWNLR